MKTYIITDSTSEITRATALKLNLIVLPLSVSCGGETILDDGSMTITDFFKMPEGGLTCKTNPILKDTFLSLFSEILQEKGAKIFGIFISSKLSRTYDEAVAAAEALKSGRIFLSDSKAVSGALGLLNFIAADMRARGYDARKIKDEIDALIPRTEMLIMLSTLKYIKAGGLARVSALRVMMGSFTIVRMEEGEIREVGRCRLKKASYTCMLKYLEKKLPEKNYAPCFINSGVPKLSDELMRLYSQCFGMERCIITTAGIACAAHFGPGAVGMAYIRKSN